jgi:hypothetical protein
VGGTPTLPSIIINLPPLLTPPHCHITIFDYTHLYTLPSPQAIRTRLHASPTRNRLRAIGPASRMQATRTWRDLPIRNGGGLCAWVRLCALLGRERWELGYTQQAGNPQATRSCVKSSRRSIITHTLLTWFTQFYAYSHNTTEAHTLLTWRTPC